MENNFEENPLYLVIKSPVSYSDKPWKRIGLPVGSIVKFEGTFIPKVAAHNQCKVHGNGSNKCRNICIAHENEKYFSNVCFEAAEYYIKLLESQSEE